MCLTMSFLTMASRNLHDMAIRPIGCWVVFFSPFWRWEWWAQVSIGKIEWCCEKILLKECRQLFLLMALFSSGSGRENHLVKARLGVSWWIIISAQLLIRTRYLFFWCLESLSGQFRRLSRAHLFSLHHFMYVWHTLFPGHLCQFWSLP